MSQYWKQWKYVILNKQKKNTLVLHTEQNMFTYIQQGCFYVCGAFYALIWQKSATFIQNKDVS